MCGIKNNWNLFNNPHFLIFLCRFPETKKNIWKCGDIIIIKYLLLIKEFLPLKSLFCFFALHSHFPGCNILIISVKVYPKTCTLRSYCFTAFFSTLYYFLKFINLMLLSCTCLRFSRNMEYGTFRINTREIGLGILFHQTNQEVQCTIAPKKQKARHWY